MIPDSCPFCEAAVTTMSDGTPCKASNGSWVSFDCLTSIHAGHDQRTGQSRKCEAAERTRLADEVARLRKDDWVGGACLHLMAQHGVPIGSPELLEAKARVEAEIETLRTANAALVDQVKALKAVTEDPQALWTNWLRGTVKLGAGIGDIRQSEQRVKRVLAARDQMAAWLCEPRNLGAVPFMADEWEAAKGQP